MDRWEALNSPKQKSMVGNNNPITTTLEAHAALSEWENERGEEEVSAREIPNKKVMTQRTVVQLSKAGEYDLQTWPQKPGKSRHSTKR